MHLDAIVGWLVSWLTTIDEKKRLKKTKAKTIIYSFSGFLLLLQHLAKLFRSMLFVVQNGNEVNKRFALQGYAELSNY